MMLVTSCEKHETPLFDTPYVRIGDSAWQSEANIDRNDDGMLTELFIGISVSDHYFTEPITIEYETAVGNGLEEGVDFKIQASTKSPVVFDPGTYTMPIRIIWYKTSGFDPSKDNTLTLTLKSSSVNDMVIGLPGPDHKNSSFKFNKL